MMAFSHDAHPGARSSVLRSVAQSRRDRAPSDDIAARLHLAAALLPEQPDEAALMLDGLLRDIVDEWCRLNLVAFAPPSAARSLDLIQRSDPLFGWRLRLALRAPDGRARLAHCRSLVAVLAVSEAASLVEHEEG